MSDAWRRKSYYRPRVLVQTDAVLESTFPDAVVCLTGGQVNLIRALLEYADRRSTFVSEYQTDGYLAPTEEEWEQLTDVVAQLEEAMSGCETIAERLACICSAIQGLQASQTVDPNLLPEGQPYYDNEDSDVEEDTGSPPVSSTWDDWRVYRCKGAQMILDDVIDLVTNWAQVAEDVGLLTFTLLEGTLIASLVGIPAAVLGAIVSFLLTNLTEFVWSETVEWISENKQGLVCAIVQGSSSSAAKASVNAYINSEWDKLWSAGFVKLVFTRYTLKQLFDEDLPSYTSRSVNYSIAYCSSCYEPLVGNDWFAVRYAADPFQDTLHVAGGTGWHSDIMCADVAYRAGKVACGFVFTVTDKTGGTLKRMSAIFDCGKAASLTIDTSDNLGNTQYFSVNGANIDETDCKDTLCPTATSLTANTRSSSDDLGIKIKHEANSSEEFSTITIDWVVYEGAP